MLRIARYFFSLFILGFLIYYICLNREAVSVNEIIQHKKSVGASILSLMVSFLAGGFGWVLILKKMGLEAPKARTLRAWFLSQVGKYVPGKIWGTVSRLYLFQENVNKVKVGYSIFLEMVLINITGFSLFLFSLIFWNPAIPGFGKKYIWSAAAIPFMLVLLHPGIMEKTVNVVLLRIKKCPVEIRLNFRQIVELFLYYIFFWCIYGLSFGILASAFIETNIRSLLIFSGIYVFSVVVGVVSVISPGGLGVREGVLSVLLSAYMPTHTAVYISIVSRIWFTLVELGMVLFFLLWRKQKSMKEAA